jgi:hypothetical protein
MDLFSPNLSLIESNLEYIQMILWNLVMFLIPIFGLYLDPDIAKKSMQTYKESKLVDAHCTIMIALLFVKARNYPAFSL